MTETVTEVRPSTATEEPPTQWESRPDFFYVKELALDLRRSEGSIRWLIHTGQIKTGKIGGRTVIARAERDRILRDAFAEAG